MTKDDITRMAKEAGFCGFDGDNKCLREFAALVAAAEREACAKILEQTDLSRLKDHPKTQNGIALLLAAYIEVIRARGQHD
jgi:hypothetical protein